MNLRRFAVVGMIILGMLAIYAAMSQGGGALSGKDGEAGSNAPPEEITYSQLLTAIEEDRIKAVEVQGETLTGVFTDLDEDGAEFALVMIRRTTAGTLEIVGEIPDDVPLVERAARKLLA